MVLIVYAEASRIEFTKNNSFTYKPDVMRLLLTMLLIVFMSCACRNGKTLLKSDAKKVVQALPAPSGNNTDPSCTSDCTDDEPEPVLIPNSLEYRLGLW